MVLLTFSFQGIVVGCITAYEFFSLINPKKLSSSPRKNRRKNKKAVNENIYAKYKDWKPKEPSYFELLKQKDERLQKIGFDFESSSNRLYTVRMNEDSFHNHNKNQQQLHDLTMSQVTISALAALLGIMLMLRMLKKFSEQLFERDH